MNDFTPYRWHDNLIHGLSLDLGDVEAGDWRSNLVLDIDHIVAWHCAADGKAQFEVAPATLTFLHAGDLRIAIDCGDSGGQVALHDLSIDRIEREAIVEQKVYLDLPYYRWTIALNWPKDGAIRFAASDFELVLRAEPLLLESARVPAAFRQGSAGSRR
jgi:hypothetical protein